MKMKFILKIGNQEFKLFNLSISNKGDIYQFFPSKPQLHLSIHSSGHTHIKSGILGIHEDIDLYSIPNFASDFYNRFQYQQIIMKKSL